jgi:thiol-disulfide isomerase/thioredoxin
MYYKNIRISNILLLLLLMLLFSCSQQPQAQTGNQPPDLLGKVERSKLENNPEHTWYDNNYREYQPDVEKIRALRGYSDDMNVEIYMGTWCPDTRRDMPKFIKVLDEIGVPEENIIIIGLDRTKTSSDDISIRRGITFVPTFIVYYKNEEVGRLDEIFSKRPEEYLLEFIKR